MSSVLPIAVITGASSGIGQSLAEQLAEAGYRVVIVARSREKLLSICDNIKSRGYSCIYIPIDIAKTADIDKLKKKALELGPISVLINNAGVGYFGPIESISIESWNEQLNVNLRASFLLSQAFIPSMKEMKCGSLVFINSIAGRQPFSESAAYVASKFGLRGLANSLREELRDHNIKVISVYPGATNTPFWKKIKHNFATQDMLRPIDLAQMILHSIKAPGNLTVEEMVIRRVSGDL